MEKKLPKFLYKAISGGYTSIGDNPAIPDYGDDGFIYEMIKERYAEVSQHLVNYGIQTEDNDELETLLSKLIVECMKREKPIRVQLEKVCENIVNEILAVPTDTVILKCKLTDSVQVNSVMRVLPDKEAYDFDDLEHVERMKAEIKKRRFINALIQGLSYYYSNFTTTKAIIDEEIGSLDGELPSLYEKITAITDFLLFNKQEKIDRDNPMQDSYVEVKLGRNDKKTVIKSQGIIFTSLLKETFRGFFELFSSHGLPEDDSDAMFIIKRSDFIVAEPWDIRLGVPMWEKIVRNFPKPIKREIPYIFSELCCLENEDFNRIVKNMLIGTKYGKGMAEHFYDTVIRDMEYQEFKNRIQKKKVDVSLISDGCFEKDEFDNLTLNEEL